MTKTHITLREVSLGYDRQAVLEQISLEVERGEFLALLGPNGAGKTTLLRGVLGIIPILAGQVEYGVDRLANPPGYVPQRETLDPIFPLTVFEIVLMGTYARLGPLRRWAVVSVKSLSPVWNRSVFRTLPTVRFGYSRAVRNNGCSSRAPLREPEILLLDDQPLASIPAQRLIMELISASTETRVSLVVLVSHHLRLVRSLVRSVIWVEGGCATKGPTETMLAPERVTDIFGTLTGTE
jgi:ABC-type Mn2+/Zn2+ transport system ATPase subunit